MNKRACLVAAVVLGAATCGAAPAALAQDSASMTVNGTTITFGGGGQYLSLPDIKFTGVGSPGSFRRQTNSDFADYGGAVGGGIETPLGFWGGYRVAGAVKGFFSSVQDNDTTHCADHCVVVAPTNGLTTTDSALTRQHRP